MVVVEQPHSPNGGSEFKYRARPNRLWGRPKGPSGGPGPHLSSPILPWFRPERRKSLFWPSGAGTPLVGQEKGAKKAPKPNERRRWPERMPKGRALGTAGATGRAGFAAVARAPHRAPTLCPQTPPPAGRGPSGHTPRAGNSAPARFQNRPHPWTSLGAAGWTLAGRGWKCSPRAPKWGLFQKRHCSSGDSRGLSRVKPTEEKDERSTGPPKVCSV